MHSDVNAQLAFHLTGLAADTVAPIAPSGVRPALLAGYRDLAALRYDFPLVLIDDRADGAFCKPLAALVDEALGDSTDERVRSAALAREREIRRQLATMPARQLSTLWSMEPKLAADGVVVDCDAAFPARFFYSAWTAAHAAKAKRFHAEAERLILELSNIVAADYARSDEGRSAERLAAGLAARDDTFDTGALSRLLATALPERRLPIARRRRLRALLATLKTQRFFPPAHAEARGYSFVFYSCGAALQALRERRTPTLELAKAVAAARLEASAQYDEAVHDRLFAELGDNAIDAALMPDYLVCLNAANLSAGIESASLAELLASGMPVKILVQHDDLLENRSAPCAQARLVLGMALGLNDVYVLQSAASNLYAVRDSVVGGLQYAGPALFNVFSGTGGRTELPPYLLAAAAMESRAFPAFRYDPAASGDRFARYSLENNAQPESDWALHRLDFADADQQRKSEELAFTLADFVACDARYASAFAVTQEPVKSDVPSIRMVDADNRLQSVLVAEPLARLAERCLDAWRGLQAFARRPQIASAPAATEVAPAPAPAPAPVPTAAPMAPATEAAKAPASDAPYIETPRCTTCEECVKINAKLFVYDANKQATIADAKAGTYAELVQAAENCQVSIIHPGKPLNPDEPGLAELLARAEPFL